MGKGRLAKSSDASPRARPPMSPEAKESEMIALAVDQAEEQLRNKTAPAQIVTHYLKLATEKERIEKEILEMQKELIAAKTEALQSAQRVEELYANALDAMRQYSGQDNADD